MSLLSRQAGNNIPACFYYIIRVTIAPMLEDSWLTALVFSMEKNVFRSLSTLLLKLAQARYL